MGARRLLAWVLSAPFRLTRFISAWINSLEYRLAADIHQDARFLPGSKVFNIRRKRDAIRVGPHSTVCGELLTFGHGGRIEIGGWCYIGEGTRIWSAEDITIGDRVLIAHNVDIHDTNSHPLDARERHDHYRQIALKGHPRNIENIISRPVKIEDDVWIGFNAMIMKGVTIKTGSIVAAGSIVTEDIPPHSVFVQGKIIKKLR